MNCLLSCANHFRFLRNEFAVINNPFYLQHCSDAFNVMDIRQLWIIVAADVPSVTSNFINTTNRLRQDDRKSYPALLL